MPRRCGRYRLAGSRSALWLYCPWCSLGSYRFTFAALLYRATRRAIVPSDYIYESLLAETRRLISESDLIHAYRYQKHIYISQYRVSHRRQRSSFFTSQWSVCPSSANRRLICPIKKCHLFLSDELIYNTSYVALWKGSFASPLLYIYSFSPRSPIALCTRYFRAARLFGQIIEKNERRVFISARVKWCLGCAEAALSRSGCARARRREEGITLWKPDRIEIHSQCCFVRARDNLFIASIVYIAPVRCGVFDDDINAIFDGARDIGIQLQL